MGLAYATSDELRVLGTEIDDEDGVISHAQASHIGIAAVGPQTHFSTLYDASSRLNALVIGAAHRRATTQVLTLMADRTHTPSPEAPKPGITDRIADFVGLAHRPAREQATRPDGTPSALTYGDRRGIAGAAGVTVVAAIALSPVGGVIADTASTPAESDVEKTSEALTGGVNDYVDAVNAAEPQALRDAEASIVSAIGAEAWATLRPQLDAAGPLTMVQRRGYEENDAATQSVFCWLLVPEGSTPEDTDFGMVRGVQLSIRPMSGGYQLIEGQPTMITVDMVDAARNCEIGGMTSAFPADLTD